MIRNIDKDSVNTVSQGALLDYIDNYTKVCSPDFNHLKSHLESLQLQERLDSCVLELALKHVDEKKDEKNGKEPLFCKDVLYHASLCCLAVNTCDSMSSLQMFLSDKKRVSGHCFQEVSLSHSKQEHSKQERYLIARQGESTYYIALQGISDIREWLKYRSFKEGTLFVCLVYRIAGIFRGYKCSWFSRIRHVPRTFITANLISHACMLQKGAIPRKLNL